MATVPNKSFIGAGKVNPYPIPSTTDVAGIVKSVIDAYEVVGAFGATALARTNTYGEEVVAVVNGKQVTGEPAAIARFVESMVKIGAWEALNDAQCFCLTDIVHIEIGLKTGFDYLASPATAGWGGDPGFGPDGLTSDGVDRGFSSDIIWGAEFENFPAPLPATLADFWHGVFLTGYTDNEVDTATIFGTRDDGNEYLLELKQDAGANNLTLDTGIIGGGQASVPLGIVTPALYAGHIDGTDLTANLSINGQLLSTGTPGTSVRPWDVGNRIFTLMTANPWVLAISPLAATVGLTIYGDKALNTQSVYGIIKQLHHDLGVTNCHPNKALPKRIMWSGWLDSSSTPIPDIEDLSTWKMDTVVPASLPIMEQAKVHTHHIWAFWSQFEDAASGDETPGTYHFDVMDEQMSAVNMAIGDINEIMFEFAMIWWAGFIPPADLVADIDDPITISRFCSAVTAVVEHFPPGTFTYLTLFNEINGWVTFAGPESEEDARWASVKNIYDECTSAIHAYDPKIKMCISVSYHAMRGEGNIDYVLDTLEPWVDYIFTTYYAGNPAIPIDTDIQQYIDMHDNMYPRDWQWSMVENGTAQDGGTDGGTDQECRDLVQTILQFGYQYGHHMGHFCPWFNWYEIPHWWLDQWYDQSGWSQSSPWFVFNKLLGMMDQDTGIAKAGAKELMIELSFPNGVNLNAWI
jgi:hypothetical protein